MAKLYGKAKAAFLARMAKGRNKNKKQTVKRPTHHIITMARKKGSKTRTVYRTVRSGGRRAGGMLKGTGGKVAAGGVIGLITTFITPRLPPTAAVLVDDASDLAATFALGKYGLIGNMIGKRLAPILVRQATGNSGLSSSIGDSA